MIRRTGFGFVYLLIKDDEIIYIGATKNWQARLKKHRNKDFNYYVVLRSSNYLQKEMELIMLYKPALNVNYNNRAKRKILIDYREKELT